MKRNNLIDTLRGFATVNMVIYHLLFDLVYTKDYKIEWPVNTPGMIWERFICISFILVSGYYFNLSHSHRKRTITLLIVSMILSVAMYFFTSEFFIAFGIIYLLCAASFLMTFVDRLTPSKKILCALSFVVFILTYKISVHLMDISSNLFSFVGFYNDKSYSGDYFPLLPWYFVYLVGYCAHDFLDIELNARENVLSKTGKKSLMIYLIHQPIIMIIVQIAEFLGGINE